MSDFDEYFQTSADTSTIPHRFDQFWKDSITYLKQFPLNLKISRKKSKLFNKYNEFELSFDGVDKYPLRASLFIPLKANVKPPMVIRFPDYMSEVKFSPELYEQGYAQMILELRGQREALALLEQSEEKQKESFGYFSENMLDPEKYYMRKLYLDAMRCLDVIRLIKEVDKNKISIWGTGIGSAMAVFLQHNADRISSIVLDEPTFVYLELTQNVSKAAYAEEINEYIKKNKLNRKKIKENLAYFDVIYLASKINIPVLMFINIEKRSVAPQGGFAMFHRIPENKDMVIFTEIEESSVSSSSKAITETIRFFNETLK
ncbi:MAG: acetylxylan esterase [Spirochaetia bacterium]|nr:acetylxylan esterase [Spirochaetia bacterium]